MQKILKKWTGTVACQSSLPCRALYMWHMEILPIYSFPNHQLWGSTTVRMLKVMRQITKFLETWLLSFKVDLQSFCREHHLVFILFNSTVCFVLVLNITLAVKPLLSRNNLSVTTTECNNSHWQKRADHIWLSNTLLLKSFLSDDLSAIFCF